MADWSTLYIGKVEAKKWRNAMPDVDDPTLCMIFRPTDRHLEPDNKRPDWADRGWGEEEGLNLDCWYLTTVGTAKGRLDRFHLSAADIDRWVSDITSIPLDRVEVAAVDPSDFYDKDVALLGPLGGKDLRALIEQDESQYWEDYELIIAHGLGRLLELRKLRRLLDTSPESDRVYLDLCYTPAVTDGEPIEGFSIITLDYDGKIPLRKDHFGSAKSLYTERQLDVVYIELAIALEEAISRYLTRKLERVLKEGQAADVIRRLVKDAPLMSVLEFISYILEPGVVEKEELDRVETAYTIRNLVVHRSMKSFEPATTADHIVAVEHVCRALDGLPL